MNMPEARLQTADHPDASATTAQQSGALFTTATPIVRDLGLTAYEPVYKAMQDFTAGRDVATPDELWMLQHHPVYTLGVAARAQHLPRADRGIPIIKIDRGGQITYHGPGQIVIYLLLEMRRYGWGVRALVEQMEQAVVDVLASHGIEAHARRDAPGVYVGAAKIAALGLRIHRGCCYHGLALNVDMDLAPFNTIDPCGYPGLTVTQTRDHGVTASPQSLGEQLTTRLLAGLKSIRRFET